MLTPPAIPGFAFTKEPFEDLLDRFLAIPDWDSELLGESVNGRPIYGFAYGDLDKPTMYVQGNIHGWHEWRTCWWVSEFMALISDPSGLPTATRDAILDLRSRYSFYFIPSVNPDGYGTPSQNGRYGNANGVSVSENFDYNWSAGIHTPPHDEYRGPYPWSEPESQVVRDKVLDLLPVSLLCNHTWGSSNVGWITRRPQNGGDLTAITTMYNAVKATLGYDDGTYTQTLREKLPTGSAYNWAGTLISPDSERTIVAQVWESGGGMSVEDQSRVGMTGILYHMLMVDDLLPDPPEPEPEQLPLIADSWGPVNLGGPVPYEVAEVGYFDGLTLLPVWPADDPED